MREIKYTTRFKRDYRREKSGLYSKKLDALLMEVVNLLAADKPLPRRNFDHPLGGEWSDHRDCRCCSNIGPVDVGSAGAGFPPLSPLQSPSGRGGPYRC
jgi:addiction module RelE/StbE family toxin